jgi:hypothetical protein
VRFVGTVLSSSAGEGSMYWLGDDGVFVVRYARAEDLDPVLQAPLVEELRSVGRERPIALVFVVGEDVHSVEVSVPAYWLAITDDPHLRLTALGVVSPHPAVRVATAGFGAANVVRGARFRVKGFDDEASAIAWAAAAVRAVSPRRA